MRLQGVVLARDVGLARVRFRVKGYEFKGFSARDIGLG